MLPSTKQFGLSVVTVVRNSLSLLQSTVDSLRLQTTQDFEYVIIDGASTDDTRAFVLNRPTPASIVISEPDSGTYDAMNKAPMLCSGEYIQYLNAGDTLYDNETVMRVLPYLDGQSDIVIFNYRIRGKQYTPSLTLGHMLGGTPCHQAIFYRRSYLLNHSFDTRLKYCADYHHLLNALFRASVRIAEPAVIDYDTSGMSSQPAARRAIRLERTWSALHASVPLHWGVAIAAYNLLRAMR